MTRCGRSTERLVWNDVVTCLRRADASISLADSLARLNAKQLERMENYLTQLFCDALVAIEKQEGCTIQELVLRGVDRNPALIFALPASWTGGRPLREAMPPEVSDADLIALWPKVRPAIHEPNADRPHRIAAAEAAIAEQYARIDGTPDCLDLFRWNMSHLELRIALGPYDISRVPPRSKSERISVLSGLLDCLVWCFGGWQELRTAPAVGEGACT
jgi:hypothetical protein